MSDKTETKAKETKEEITLESTNARIDQMVNILNNIISYCNTIEKWRTMQFKKAEPEKSKKETEVISDADDKK